MVQAHRWSWGLIGVILAGGLWVTSCQDRSTVSVGRISIGVVAYGDGARSIEQFTRFNEVLSQETRSVVELEPVYNERKALEELARGSWSMVFASPGLTAIAIDDYQYIPLFPAQGSNQLRSVLVVQSDSPARSLSDLNGSILGLGQPGSATSYYLPLYDLYGSTLEAIEFVPTPAEMLGRLDEGEVDIGALAKHEFDSHRVEFPPDRFRILHTSRGIPRGAVLLGPQVDRNQQVLLTSVMNQLPPDIAEDVGYIPNATVPNYDFLIELIRTVKPIEAKLGDTPALLFDSDSTTP